MHSSLESGEKVPAFLFKLWNLVNNEATDHLICWRPNGKSFVLYNQQQFSRELLPLYYKHNNMASFVRQLNMYGFRKVPSLEGGGLRLDRDEMEFAHPHFIMGREDSLEYIKRKLVTSRATVLTGSLEDTRLQDVMTQVAAMRQKQEKVINQLTAIKRENQIVWRNYVDLQEKFAKQQSIIGKLVNFLMSLMKSQNMSRGSRKLPQLSAQNIFTGHNIVPALMHGGNSLSPLTDGPMIHEVTDDLVLNDKSMAANSSDMLQQHMLQCSSAALCHPDMMLARKQPPMLENTAAMILSDSTTRSLLQPAPDGRLDAGLMSSITLDSVNDAPDDASVVFSSTDQHTSNTVKNSFVLPNEFSFSPRGVILDASGNIVEQFMASSTSQPSRAAPSSNPVVASPKGSILSTSLPADQGRTAVPLMTVVAKPQAAVTTPLTTTKHLPALVLSQNVKPINNGKHFLKSVSIVRPDSSSISDTNNKMASTITYTRGLTNTLHTNGTVINTPLVLNTSSALQTFPNLIKPELPSTSASYTKQQPIVSNINVMPFNTSTSRAAFHANNTASSNKVNVHYITSTVPVAGKINRSNTRGKKINLGKTAYQMANSGVDLNNGANNSSNDDSSNSNVDSISSGKFRKRQYSVIGSDSDISLAGVEDSSVGATPVFKVVRKQPGSDATYLVDSVPSSLNTPNITLPSPLPGNQIVPAAVGTTNMNRDDMGKDIEELQSKLDNLQAMFNTGQIQCDSSSLMNIFHPELPLGDIADLFCDGMLSSESSDGEGNQQQLSLYQPSLKDLTALMDSPDHQDRDAEQQHFSMAPIDPELLAPPTHSPGGRKRLKGHLAAAAVKEEQEYDDDIDPILQQMYNN